MTDRDLLAEIRAIVREELTKAGRATGGTCADVASESSGPTGTRRCYVYFMHSAQTGLIKIGISVSPEDRRAQLQDRMHEDLVILAIRPGGREAERSLHAAMRRYRVHHEWFRDADEIRALIAESWAWDDAQAMPCGGWPDR